MALTPLRKKLNIAVGLLFLGAICYVLWPLVSRPLESIAFCLTHEEGVDFPEMRRFFSDKGFRVSPLADSGAHVYRRLLMGARLFALRIKAGVLASASFALSD